MEPINPSGAQPLPGPRLEPSPASQEAAKAQTLFQKYEGVCRRTFGRPPFVSLATFEAWKTEAGRFAGERPTLCRLVESTATLTPDSLFYLHRWEEDNQITRGAYKGVYFSVCVKLEGTILPTCDLISMGSLACKQAQTEEDLAVRFANDPSPKAQSARPYLMPPSFFLSFTCPGDMEEIPCVLQIQPLGIADLATLCTKPAFPFPARVEALIQATRVLDYLSEIQWVHNDMKLENLLLMRRDPSLIKVIDFGLASKENIADAGGTCIYAPLAILRQTEPVTCSRDTYAVKVCAFLLLTGANPLWDAASEKSNESACRLAERPEYKAIKGLLEQIGTRKRSRDILTVVNNCYDARNLGEAIGFVKALQKGMADKHVTHAELKRLKAWGRQSASDSVSSNELRELITFLKIQRACRRVWQGFDRPYDNRPSPKTLEKRLEKLRKLL